MKLLSYREIETIRLPVNACRALFTTAKCPEPNVSSKSYIPAILDAIGSTKLTAFSDFFLELPIIPQ